MPIQQVLRFVHEYTQSKINFRCVDPREIGQERYTAKLSSIC